MSRQRGGADATGGCGSRGEPLDLSEVNEVLCQLEAEGGPEPQGQLGDQARWVERHFGGAKAASLQAILASLEVRQRELADERRQRSGEGQEADEGKKLMDLEASWIGETLLALARGSPLSQRVTLELLRRTKTASLRECFNLDLRLVEK